MLRKPRRGTMLVLVDESNVVCIEDSEKLDELRRRTIERPVICEHGCKEVFDRAKGVTHDLQDSPLFCSPLCAYRHKKRLLAKAGVMMK